MAGLFWCPNHLISEGALHQAEQAITYHLNSAGLMSCYKELRLCPCSMNGPGDLLSDLCEDMCVESPVLSPLCSTSCAPAASDAVRTELQQFLPRAHHAVLAMGATLHLLGSLLAPQHSGEAGPEAQQQDLEEDLAATVDSAYDSQVPQQAPGAPPSQQSVADSQQGSLQGDRT